MTGGPGRQHLRTAAGRLSQVRSIRPVSLLREYAPSISEALMPGLCRDALAARRLGLSVPRWRAARSAGLDLLPSLRGISDGLVVDLGANIGDWTAALLRAVPTAQVLAVEPAAAPRATLERRFEGDARITVDGRAVAGSVSLRDFRVTEHSHNASLYAPRDMDVYYGHGWGVNEVVTVETTTIDDLVGGRALALMKIDVQGAEREVLAGAVKTLKRTAAVLLEVTFASHYEGAAPFAWLHEHMTSRGFALVGMSPPFLSQQGAALWADACYARLAVERPGSDQEL